MNGKRNELLIDKCFEEYKKEFNLKQHVAVNIEMVNSGMRSEARAFESIRDHYISLGLKL